MGLVAAERDRDSGRKNEAGEMRRSGDVILSSVIKPVFV